MQQRRLDVSTGAGGQVAVHRRRFDVHMDECVKCQGQGPDRTMCAEAEVLWRTVVNGALNIRRTQS